MPNWKKVIVSGSDASLNSVTASTLTLSNLVVPPTTITTPDVLILSSSGQVYVTASTAIGGGGGPISVDELITTGSTDAVQAITGSLIVSGSLSIPGIASVTGSLYVSSSLINYQENSNVTSPGYQTVISVPINTSKAAFFDFVIFNGSNIRAGTVTATWLGGTMQYTEASTNDIGNTSGVQLVPVISGANILLQATASSDTWMIKSLVRLV